MIVELFFAEYLRVLETMHREFVQAIEGLPAEAVNWSPGEGMNSLAMLAAHTAGAARYWIGDVIMSEPSGRDRPSEFLVVGASANEALGGLRSSLRYVQDALARLDAAELPAARTAPGDGRVVSVSWALLHALEHTAVHVGHAELTRQLWEAKAAGR